MSFKRLSVALRIFLFSACQIDFFRIAFVWNFFVSIWSFFLGWNSVKEFPTKNFRKKLFWGKFLWQGPFVHRLNSISNRIVLLPPSISPIGQRECLERFAVSTLPLSHAILRSLAIERTKKKFFFLIFASSPRPRRVKWYFFPSNWFFFKWKRVEISPILCSPLALSRVLCCAKNCIFLAPSTHTQRILFPFFPFFLLLLNWEGFARPDKNTLSDLTGEWQCVVVNFARGDILRPNRCRLSFENEFMAEQKSFLITIRSSNSISALKFISLPVLHKKSMISSVFPVKLARHELSTHKSEAQSSIWTQNSSLSPVLLQN